MRQHPLITAFAASLALVLSGAASAAPDKVSGLVSNVVTRDPLMDCAIAVLLDGLKPSREPSVTDSDGRFLLDLAILYPTQAASAHTLVIEFTKAGFNPSRRCIALEGSTPIPALDVRLAAISGTTEIGPELQRHLNSHKSSSGRTLYLFQYAMPAGDGTISQDTLTWRLSWNLKLAINGHLQSIFDALSQSRGLIDVDTLNCAENTSNSERVVAIGRYLNALAMINGAAVAKPGPVMGLMSEFHTVRRLPPYSPYSTALENDLEGDLSDAQRVSGQLGDDWRSLGVLAVIERELEDARESAGKDKLCDLSRTVVAQLATMRPHRSPVADAVIHQLQAIQAEVRGQCQ
jgi:hypothetical protein